LACTCEFTILFTTGQWFRLNREVLNLKEEVEEKARPATTTTTTTTRLLVLVLLVVMVVLVLAQL
jgi:hypothetical protein